MFLSWGNWMQSGLAIVCETLTFSSAKFWAVTKSLSSQALTSRLHSMETIFVTIFRITCLFTLHLCLSKTSTDGIQIQFLLIKPNLDMKISSFNAHQYGEPCKSYHSSQEFCYLIHYSFVLQIYIFFFFFQAFHMFHGFCFKKTNTCFKK